MSRFNQSRRRFALTATAFVIASSCGDGGTEPGGQGACTGDVTINVSSGTTPTFTWTPSCRVIGLLVERDAADMWLIEQTGSAGIASGVTYGTVPAGAAQTAPAEPLVAGTTYEVLLFRGTENDAIIAGLRTFTP